MTNRAQVERRSRRQELRRRQILDAAAEVFATVGYDRATLELIGEAVGLSKTSLYYYFQSKESLLACLVVSSIEDIEAQYARSGGDGEDPVTALTRFIQAHLRVACTPAGQVVCRNLDFVFGTEVDAAMADARRRHQRRLREILTSGVEDGVFRPIDVRRVAALVLAALNTVPLWYPHAQGAEAIADEASALVLRGLVQAAPPD